MDHQPTEVVKLIVNEDFDSFEYGRIIGALVIGVGTALKEKTISFDEAEQYLFNSHTMEILKLMDVPKEVVDLIHTGMELEEVRSLVPRHFDEILGKMIALAHQQVKFLPKTRDLSDKWFTTKPRII